jgi:hypothetical protein
MILWIVLFSLIAALAWHSVVPKFWFASAGSTITAVLAVWFVSSSHFGYFDQTFYENLVIVGSIGFVISMLIGRVVGRIKGKAP